MDAVRFPRAARPAAAAPTLILALALALCWAAPARALDWRGLSFDVPEGWQAQERGEALSLSRPLSADDPGRNGRAGRDGQALILLMLPSSGEAGGLEAALARFGRIPEQTANERPRTERGETPDGHPMAVQSRCCGRAGSLSVRSVHVGIAAPGATRLVALVTVGAPRQSGREAEAQFAALVRTLRPTGAVPARLAPPAGPGLRPGGLDGAWTRMNLHPMPNAFGGIDMQAEMEVRVFDPAGRYATAMPVTPDLAAFCDGRPTACGTYALGEGRIALVETENAYGMVRRSTEALSHGANGELRIGTDSWQRIEPFPAETRLDGTWTHRWASSGSTATGSGGVSGQRTLALSPDGRFRRGGAVGLSSSFEGGASVAGSRRRAEETGTYAIEGHTLVLNPDGGTTERLSIFRGDRGSDRMLVIGGDNYLRPRAEPGAAPGAATPPAPGKFRGDGARKSG